MLLFRWLLCVCVQLDPKRLKKDLLKSLKLIKGEDRVLIVGTTKDPQSAEIKSFCKMYSKIILIPRPDYGSRCSRGDVFTYFLIFLKKMCTLIVKFWKLFFSSSFVEETYSKTGRGNNGGAGSQLSCKAVRWLHPRSHGPGHPERCHQASHLPAGDQTTDRR